MALTIDKGKTAFLSMHFQNDLVHEDGKFAFVGAMPHIKQTNCLGNTKKVMEACRRVGVPVVHVRVAVTEVQRNMLTDVAKAPLFVTIASTGALMEGTWGAEICDEVKPERDDFVVLGGGMNSFYGNTLGAALPALGIRTIILSGFATNFVVESTARYACDLLYEVIILRDCCASFNEEAHSFTLNNVLPNLAAISDSAEFVKALG
jgi:nicotinamidase-related amidase